MQKVTVEWLKDVYEKIYRAGDNVVHPRVGKLQPYGCGSPRDEAFHKFVTENLLTGAKVLDASCGRGRLLRMLLESGYDAEGTEIAPCLLEEGQDLHGLPVRLVDYANIANCWEPGTFDAVISNDVLEHLAGHGEVTSALESLAFLSNKFLLVSVGLTSAPKYCTALNIPMQNLHRVRKPARWWHKQYSAVARPQHIKRKTNNWRVFGTVKKF